MPKRFSDDEPRDLGRGRTQARSDARAFHAVAARLFELPEHRRKAFPGSPAVMKALLINRTNIVKNAFQRHIRHIAGLLRNEGFSVGELEAYLAGGRLKAIADEGPDLQAIRDGLCDPARFEETLSEAVMQFAMLDVSAIRRFAELCHEGEDRKAYSALYKTLRSAADAAADESDDD